MTKKLTKHGNELALILEKPILENLGITDETDLELVVMGDVLLVKSKNPRTDERATLKKIATSIMDEYEEVFKKLSKT